MARDKCCAWAMLGLMMCAVVQVGGVAPSPSPSVDCTSALGNLADCLSYVQAGSTVAKPEETCCSGLKKVVKEDVACLCEALKASSSIGVALNITRALSLPQACGVSTPPVSECHISIPGLAPSPAPSPSAASPGGGIAGASGPSPGKSGGSIAGASGPSPGKSSMAAASPAPFLALLVSVAMAFYSY